MKGKIGYDPKMRRHFVSWYHAGKTHKIWYYNGWKLQTREIAEASYLPLCEVMNSVEFFRIEKYLNAKSEVSPLFDEWLERIVIKRAPSTYEYYKAMVNKHVKNPFSMRAG